MVVKIIFHGSQKIIRNCFQLGMSNEELVIISLLSVFQNFFKTLSLQKII